MAPQTWRKRCHQNLLMLSDVKVKNIMTPREAVVAFSCEQTVENVVKSRYRSITRESLYIKAALTK